MASTLQRFVSGVVGKVVVFVLLEQVAGVHLVAVLHQTLRNPIQNVNNYNRNSSVFVCENEVWMNRTRPTSSLTSRAEHCRGTDIILCGFHVTELALKLTKKKITSDPLDLHKLLTLSPVCVPPPQKYHLPVNSVQLPPVSPGHEEASSPRTLTGNSVIFQMSQKMKLIVIFIVICS